MTETTSTTTLIPIPFGNPADAVDSSVLRDLLQLQIDLTRDVTAAWSAAMTWVSRVALAQAAAARSMAFEQAERSWGSWFRLPPWTAAGRGEEAGGGSGEPAGTAAETPAGTEPDVLDGLIELMVQDDLAVTVQERISR